MQAKLTATQAATIIAARGYSTSDRRATKNRVFAEAKAAFGIPASVKLKAEVDDTSSPDYLVLKDKNTGATFTAPTPINTPSGVNSAPTSTDAKPKGVAASGSAGDIPAPAASRFVTVTKKDVFINPNTDEIVVRIPA